MKTDRFLIANLAFASVLALAFALPVNAQEVDCDKCHAGLTQKKVVHAAVRMGCKTCHDQLDATIVPHKSTGKFAKGLSGDPSAQCSNCHESKLFQGKITHGPVAGGPCEVCHNPHASDNIGLLNKEPAVLCLDCHSDVRKKSHVIVSFSGGGHPMGDVKKAKEVEDPLRPGKKFYCVACHEPHRSEWPMLTRFAKGMSSCQKCHNM